MVIAVAIACFFAAYYLTDYPSIQVISGTKINYISPRRELEALSLIAADGYSSARPIYEMERASFLRRQVASGCLAVAGVVILVLGVKKTRAKGIQTGIDPLNSK